MKRAHAVLWSVFIVIAILASAAGYMAFNWPQVRHVLGHWTGEEDLREQLKGTGALILLYLSQPALDTEPFVPIAHTGVSPYGINTFLEQEADPAVVDRSLAMVTDAGFRWIRQEFPWEDIEISGKGDYYDHRWDRSAWEKYDTIVELAEKHGVGIIARLDNPPAWSREVGNAEGWRVAPPDNIGDYGDFVHAVVSRYRGRIRYYQIWNEPNIYPEWGDQPADPAGYVELLKVGYTRAKQADPDCVIVAAGLAQTTEETPPEFGPRNMSDLLYLEQMYQAGAKGYFDIMGSQVYGLWTGAYDRRASRDRTNMSRVQLLRQIMVRHGDASKPVWATEVGWNAMPSDVPAPPSYGRVTETQQAVYTVEAYQRAAREWPWMGVMNYWFLRRPNAQEIDQAWYYFRMLEPDFAELPVYGAVRWLATQEPALEIGYHQEDHYALDYDGPWQHIRDERAVLGAYAMGASGASLHFRFRGTSLALVMRRPAEIDALRVTLDGEQIDITRPWSLPATEGTPLAIARSLSDSEHDVVIDVMQDGAGLDGIIVWRREQTWALYAALAAAALAGVSCFLVALLRRPGR